MAALDDELASLDARELELGLGFDGSTVTATPTPIAP